MISVEKAEQDPAHAVLATADADSQPVRTAVSPDGAVVWVTARGSDRVLGFSVTKLLSDTKHALVASVKVGSAPVGFADFDNGSRLIVADSNRFNAKGARASVTILNTKAALAHRANAILSSLQAGGFPRDIAIGEDNKLALISDFDSDQLETVSLPAQ